MARDLGSAESIKIVGILCVFPNFSTARMGQKTRHSAADELFRGSLDMKSSHKNGFLRQYHSFASNNSAYADFLFP